MTEARFAETLALAESIEGMMSRFSVSIFDCLLAHQAARGLDGDIVELGVFRGKSAAVLARHLTEKQSLHLYDINDNFDRTRLERTGKRMIFNVANTLDLRPRDFAGLKRSVRFCHIDASHMLMPTMHEMALADYMLADNGILCLDDYTNLNYSQILAAAFKYLFTTSTDLTMFMVTNEKAYLCRRKSFAPHEAYILDELRQDMAVRGMEDTCLARTDLSPDYRAIHVRLKEGNETDDLYGASIYGQFYRPSGNPGFVQRLAHKYRDAVPVPMRQLINKVRRRSARSAS